MCAMKILIWFSRTGPTGNLLCIISLILQIRWLDAYVPRSWMVYPGTCTQWMAEMNLNLLFILGLMHFLLYFLASLLIILYLCVTACACFTHTAHNTDIYTHTHLCVLGAEHCKDRPAACSWCPSLGGELLLPSHMPRSQGLWGLGAALSGQSWLSFSPWFSESTILFTCWRVYCELSCQYQQEGNMLWSFKNVYHYGTGAGDKGVCE